MLFWVILYNNARLRRALLNYADIRSPHSSLYYASGAIHKTIGRLPGIHPGGFQQHIAKPVEPSELLAAVAKLSGRGE